MIVQTCSHLSHNDSRIFLVRICVLSDKAKVSLNLLVLNPIKVKLKMCVHSSTECVEEESQKKTFV